MSIKKGDKVYVGDPDNYGMLGRVENIYGEDLVSPEIAVVRLVADNSLVKVHIDKITPVTEDKPQTEKKGVVTITEDEFRHIVTDLAIEKSKGNFTLGLGFTLFGHSISEKLFGEADND